MSGLRCCWRGWGRGVFDLYIEVCIYRRVNSLMNGQYLKLKANSECYLANNLGRE